MLNLKISKLVLTLAVLAGTSIVQAEDIYCGTPDISRCPASQICIKPAPNVRCRADSSATCPGVCRPSCLLTENGRKKSPCPFGQPCTAPTYARQTFRYGFCPDPAFCGGIATIKCEGKDEVCIDDPRDDCINGKGGAADCGSICVPSWYQPPSSAAGGGGGQPCGAKTGKTCPADYECVENTTDDCEPKKGYQDCPGICQKKGQEQPTDQTCGGIYGKKCPTGFTCFDNPKDGCDPKKNAADCPGLCVKKTICATLKGIQCPEGLKCVDDDEGDCKGGIAADCPGVCVEA